MPVFDKLLALIAPYQCLGCDREGNLLCSVCIELFEQLPERCYRCHKYSAASLTCPRCRKASKLYRVQAATVYEGIAKQIVWKFKFGGVQSAAQQLAHAFPRLHGDTQAAVIVPIPTATSRIRQRGYDQALLLARATAKITALPCHPVLVRVGQAHQVGASRLQRRQQLAGAFRVTRLAQVKGQYIILIDDVLTTGATLEEAALTLKQAGAKRIDAIIFAQA